MLEARTGQKDGLCVEPAVQGALGRPARRRWDL